MVRHALSLQTSITVSRASRADIPSLVDVIIAAFRPDVLVQLAYPSYADRREELIHELESVWDLRGLWPLVAKDTSTGMIVGEALWAIVHDSRAGREEGEEDWLARFCGGALFGTREERGKKKNLEDVMNDGLLSKRREWVDGKKRVCMPP